MYTIQKSVFCCSVVNMDSAKSDRNTQLLQIKLGHQSIYMGGTPQPCSYPPDHISKEESVAGLTKESW